MTTGQFPQAMHWIPQTANQGNFSVFSPQTSDLMWCDSSIVLVLAGYLTVHEVFLAGSGVYHVIMSIWINNKP